MAGVVAPVVSLFVVSAQMIVLKKRNTEKVALRWRG
jgi:hypothetical protein